jgi:hypothetical protein
MRELLRRNLFFIYNIKNFKGGPGVLSHYSGSFAHALIDAYGASAGFDERFQITRPTSTTPSFPLSHSPSTLLTLFAFLVCNYKIGKKEPPKPRMDIAREFFDSFSQKKGFSPLLAQYWYSVSTSTLLSEKVSDI